MNNRMAPSAAISRAGETYVLDLTSVCVRSGTIRLPLSLLGRFEEGELTAHADGEELTLQFQAPRTLLGLGAFFDKCELKSNDRVCFEFRDDELELRAMRRERQRSAPKVQQSAPPQAEPTQQRAPTPGSARLSGRGIFPSPAELVNDEQTQQQEAHAGAEAAAAEGAAPDKAEPQRERRNENSVRAVHRVRIEGGTPPRADTPAPRPIDRASARDVWARRQNPTWRSLDTIVAGPVVPTDDTEEAFSDTTVRVIRRSKGTSTPLEVEAPAVAAPKAPVSYSTSWPLDEKPRRADRRPAAPVDGDRAELDPYLDAPLDVEREMDYVPTADISENDLYSPPAGEAERHRESEQAYERFRSSDSDEPAGQRERRPGLLGRLGLTRNASRSDAALGSGDTVEREPVSVEVPRRNRSDDSSQKSFAASGFGEPAGAAPAVPTYSASPTFSAPQSASVVVEPPAEVATDPERAPAPPARPSDRSSGQTAEPRVIVDDAVYELEYDTAVLVSGAEDEVGAADTGATLEGDIAILKGYFERPDVPAIVRCDDLAVRLSMDRERVVHAMSRLAEDRERFTALRGDAFMIRRPH